MSTPKLDPDIKLIATGLRSVLFPGQVTELRALDVLSSTYRYPRTESGYFDDVDKLAEAAASISHAKGVYFIPNPVNPALLSRAANRLRSVGKGDLLTSDGDIDERRWLLIDCDPVRPTGISSTSGEHTAAYEKVTAVRTHLGEQGWSDPIFADSGNGYHLMYQIDIAVDDGGLVQRCLEVLADLFDDDQVKIDRTVFNPGRVWKLYGSIARKGDDTVDRPHRVSQIDHAPDFLEPVATSLLETLAAQAPAAKSIRGSSANKTGFDLDKWIAGHGLESVGPENWRDRNGQMGRRWKFQSCPWNSDHTNGSAFIVQFADGAIAAGCHHNSCSGNDWPALRATLGSSSKATDKTDKSPCGSNVSSVPKGAPDFWPGPQPLPDALAAVMPFDFELLPATLRPWIEDIAARMQCPPDFPAVAAMVAIASLVGRKVGIRPKRQDDWLVVPNLWGGVIGRPGILKTPAIQEPLRPLERLELEAKQRFEHEQKEFEASAIVAEQRRRVTEAEIREALREEADAHAIARKILEQESAEPTRQRYVVNDCTVEKLGELLKDNGNGFAVFRDELVGLLRVLDKEGHESARAFYLEAWNGTGRFTYDRIKRGTIDIEAAILSIIGGIQPGPLAQYLRAAIDGGVGDDGLLQRFQLAVWPDISAKWVNIDHWPNSHARTTAYAVFTRLNDLNPAAVGAKHDLNDPDAVPYFRFTADAQEVFDAWRAVLEPKIRSGDEHPAIESHLSKYRSLIPSLALLIHLAEDRTGPVSAESLERAIRWGEYLETHVRRIYSVAVKPDAILAKTLARKIQNGSLKPPFALRDVYRPSWTGLSSKSDALRAVDALMELDWLREIREETRGATRKRYVVNPKIWETLKDGTDKADKRGQSDLLSALSVPSERGDHGSAGIDDGPIIDFFDLLLPLGTTEDAGYLAVCTLPEANSTRFTDARSAAAQVVDVVSAGSEVRICPFLVRGGHNSKIVTSEMATLICLWACLRYGPSTAGAGNAGAMLPSRNQVNQVLAAVGVTPTFVIDTGHELQAWWMLKEPWPINLADVHCHAENLIRQFDGTLVQRARERGIQLQVDTRDSVQLLHILGTARNIQLVEQSDYRYVIEDFDAILFDAT